jgi:hypothetical protein
LLAVLASNQQSRTLKTIPIHSMWGSCSWYHHEQT